MGFDRLAMEHVTRAGVVFPGQGSQTVGMGGNLAETFPAAADLFRRAQRVLGYDLLAMVRKGPEERLRETRYSQRAIFVVNYALARSADVALDVVASAGHSFGEYCSLTLAEALTFENALHLVHERALAMQAAAEAAPGAMAAILGLDVNGIQEALALARTAGRVALANFNAPSQIVVSGDVAAVTRAGELALNAGAKRVVPLNVSGAWHSELMESAQARFAPHVAAATIALPRFPVISNVDAQPYRDVATIRTNLVRSVVAEVQWHAAALRLLQEDVDLVVEFGGSAVLAPLMKRLPGAPETLHVGDERAVTSLLQRRSDGAA